MPRRKPRGRPLDGWLIIDKPPGLTSTDVVNRVRRAFGCAERRSPQINDQIGPEADTGGGARNLKNREFLAVGDIGADEPAGTNLARVFREIRTARVDGFARAGDMIS